MLNPINLDLANRIINLSGANPEYQDLAKQQTEGAVALYNMLVTSGIGYLADEVGMGKTYIALAVVALLRTFKPDAKVLYLCPGRNIQEKWANHEYPSFLRNNIVGNNLALKGPDGKSSVPALSCNNLNELIKAMATGYYADVFVRISSFSLGMTDNAENKDRLKAIRQYLPADFFNTNEVQDKDVAKDEYARALNYLLPTFDLVIIDEAQKFKHDFNSSDRNKVLSRILGFRELESKAPDQKQLIKRAERALLLSATPYDLSIKQLHNQLKLVGKGHLLNGVEDSSGQEEIRESLAKFMVRRLNTLQVGGESYTRNMYRREYRTGKKAEVQLNTQQKLIMALVDKKIGDLVASESSGTQKKGATTGIEMGLLASFESFEQSSLPGVLSKGKSGATHDSDDANQGEGAKDESIIKQLRESYIKQGLGSTLPHPKMDQVVKEVAEEAFDNFRKQLIFVRRIRSVDELKDKLNAEYDARLIKYIEKAFEGRSVGNPLSGDIDNYFKSRHTEFGAEDNEGISKNSFFSHFFRSNTKSKNLRDTFTSSNRNNSVLFKLNWARLLLGEGLEEYVSDNETKINKELCHLLRQGNGVAKDDYPSSFSICQKAVLKVLYNDESKSWNKKALRTLADSFDSYISWVSEREKAVESLGLKDVYKLTFFDAISEIDGLFGELFGSADELRQNILDPAKTSLGDNVDWNRAIRRTEVHRQLISRFMRLDHGFIDLYLARELIGNEDLNIERRKLWMQTLGGIIENQKSNDEFSTYNALKELNSNLDLVLKNNLSNWQEVQLDRLRNWLQLELQQSEPVSGASGETSGNRSQLARRFRMPSYPLVLVTTNVLQEGEDLHTFCDSVIHYGISATPMNMEQKVGRVDRVGSKTQRRLASIASDKLNDDDKIQVRYPFIKESVEALQVREIATRLNDFIEQLHTGHGGATISKSEPIRLEDALKNRYEIPEQINEFLESPFAVDVNSLLARDEDRAHAVLDEADKQQEEVLSNLRSVLEECGFKEEKSWVWAGVKANTKAYKAFISASPRGRLLTLRIVDSRVLEDSDHFSIEKVQEFYKGTLARTYGYVADNQHLKLRRDIKILIGEGSITTQEDVAKALESFNTQNNATAQFVSKWDAAAILDYLRKYLGFSGQLTVAETADGDCRLQFIFTTRRQNVDLSIRNGFVYFESKAASAKDTKRLAGEFSEPLETGGLTISKLLELTWLRNSGQKANSKVRDVSINNEFELGEATVNTEGELVMRAVHWHDSMGLEEFAYTAYTLAVEADRLEYLISNDDVF